MSSKYLKVKIKSLTAEAQFIRKEERKAKTSKTYRRAAKRMLRLGVEVGKGSFRRLTNIEAEIAAKRIQTPEPEALELFFGLQEHRKTVVRNSARATHIAYGFVRGKDYNQIEQGVTFRSFRRVDWKAVKNMVMKYGSNESQQRLITFLNKEKIDA